ncbi:hypothetical protein KZZ52_54005 [Dactylosporangium sp. AC04546]|uniref:hypothetical protein n=1 Tax=Dactylosporangium sp. AC04546 TaxID=2862460 RepID=UPI002E7ACD93|nr:hypothetical protein [Dactylosporangium sp. AC04546]WVK82771.1 hypothetical protein KZZ52_54005 [Dactylosporangium sp. AC04546]
MTTSNVMAQQAPLYVRVLRLRHLHMGGFVSFLLFECMIAAGVLLALAEFVTWWAVPVLPAVVAIMVKVNDMAIGGSRRTRRRGAAEARGSSDRASTARVDPDSRTAETASVHRRTATALDRAEIARTQRERRAPVAVGAGSSSSSSGAGSSTGRAGTRTASRHEPPAQRKKVGVIKISLPPKKDSRSSGARSSSARPDEPAPDYGISPGADPAPESPAPAQRPGSDGPEAESTGAHAAPAPAQDPWGADLAGTADDEWPVARSTEWSGEHTAPLDAGPAQHEEGWPSRDAHGRRSRDGERDGSGEYTSGTRIGHGEWGGSGEHVAEARGGLYSDDTVGWGDQAAWSTPAGGYPTPAAQRNWGDETAWGDRSDWGEREGADRTPAWGGREGEDRTASWGGHEAADRTAGWGGRDADSTGGWGGHEAADRVGGRADRDAAERAGSWSGRDAADAVDAGDDSGGWGDPAAWTGGADRASRDRQVEWDEETGWANQAAWGGSTGWDSRIGRSGWDDGRGSAYVSAEGAYGAEDTGQRAAFSEADREQAARDHAARGEAYQSGQYGGEAYRGEHHHGESDGRFRESEAERAYSREAAGGPRHARPLGGRRRADETTDNVSTGHFSTGRHAERPWRTDDDLARQRTGGVNQGRFS